MRYLLRTHRVSVAWLHETFSRGYIRMFYEDSSKMCADIYTKAFTDLARWQHACSLINVIDPAQLAAFCSKGADASAAPAISVPGTIVNTLATPSHGLLIFPEVFSVAACRLRAFCSLIFPLDAVRALLR